MSPEVQVDAILEAASEARYLDEGRHAFLALEQVMATNRVYDYGAEEPFELLRRAHAKVEAHLQASVHAHWVKSMRPGSLKQEDSVQLLGLQAADVTVAVASRCFERHGRETHAGAQAVRRLFDRRQGLVDPFNQIVKAEWLGDVIVCPTLKSAKDVLLLALGRQHYHRNAFGALIIFQSP